MSALLVDELVVQAPRREQPNRWRHVDRGPEARPNLVALPGGRPVGVPAPELRVTRVAPSGRPAATTSAAPLRLTDRGIAVIVVFFLALVVTAAVVLVSGFLGVSNDPIQMGDPVSEVASARS